MNSAQKRVDHLMKHAVLDVLANIVAQTQEFIRNIDAHGVRTSELVDVVEFLVNEVSILKTWIINTPKIDNSKN